MRFRPYPVPEFPTDNHAIHLGASWICLSTTGTPRAVRRPSTGGADQEPQQRRVQLTPLPAPVAERTQESRFVSTPLPPSVGSVGGGNIPIPPASLLQGLLVNADAAHGAFKVQVPNAHLLSDLARPRRTDEYHVDNAPGPLLSQLMLLVESDLPFPELTVFPSANHDEDIASPPSVIAGEVALPQLEIIEADASVPPPVAELLESLPAPASSELDVAALDAEVLEAELLEVLNALARLDAEGALNLAPERQSTALQHQSSAPESGIQVVGSHPAAEPQSLDELADAIADALCAEFAPPPSEPAFNSAMSAAEQRAVAPQLKYPQLAPEPQQQPEQQPEQPKFAGADELVSQPPLANRTATPVDQFASFVSALSAVAMSAGSSRAAAVLPRLLAGKLLDCTALPDEVIDCLARQNIAHPRGSCVEPSPEFIASAAAWGDLLRGVSDDMSACGDTLDHFAANLLCALMGSGADRQSIRRDLRKRGVAAFGMLERAA